MKPLLSLGKATWSREEAAAYCRRLAKSHYENFTVGSLLLPRDKRRHVYAIYSFCRTVDDLGDEAPGDREKLLNRWSEELDQCYGGKPRHPVMIALEETAHIFGIPQEPFRKLIEANRMDQRNKRHPTYQDLLYYCDHSANPVGHLFLYLFGYGDAERQHLSDCTCTALQLANFWQDVARDHRMGRVYIPLEDMAHFGYTEEELARGVVNDSFRQMMAFEVDRARQLFRQGLGLVQRVEGRARLDIALFSRGGLAILGAIERQRYDVLSRRPSLTRARKGWLFLTTWLRISLGQKFPSPSMEEGQARPERSRRGGGGVAPPSDSLPPGEGGQKRLHPWD